MGFLSPWMLLGLAGLGVPVWLHLRRRRRHAPLEFSSLRYLRLAAARVRRQARLEDWPLLLARCLLVVLLGLAVARPVMRARGGWLGHGRSVEAVVVLDATASMGAREGAGTRFSEVKKMAREWINSLEARDEVALWVLGDRLERVVSVPTGDHAKVLAALDAAEPGDGSSSLGPAFAAAREWAAQPSKGRKELVVFTDSQRAAWNWPAERFFRDDWDRGAVAVAVMQPDLTPVPNTSIDSVEWDVRDARPERRVSGTARLSNASAQAVSEVVEVHLGGELACRKVAEVPAGGAADVALDFMVPAAGGKWLGGEVALTGDAYGPDDHWWFVMAVRRPPRVVVFDAEAAYPGALRASHFLVRALSAGRGAEVDTAAGSEWTDRDLAKVDTVFATGSGLPDTAAWGKARAFAEGGGTVVLFADGEDRGKWDGWPVNKGEEFPFPAGRIATRLLVPAHPLFDGVWSERLPFPPLSQRVARRCEPSAGSIVLGTMAGQLPLLVERRVGAGRIYWLNAAADRSWGDMPLSPVWVPLVQQLARGGAMVPAETLIRRVGDAWPTVSGAGVDWGRDDRVGRAGLHVGMATGGSVWTCAANVPREESDLRPVDTGWLQPLLPGQVGTGEAGLQAWRDEVGREVPLWPWLLTAAAVVYAVEGWWSARAGLRRALRMAEDIPSPVRPPKRRGRAAA